MINPTYTAQTKQNGQVLDADAWNSISSAVATAHTEINNILSSPVSGESVVSVTQDQLDADKKIITIDGVLVGELTDKGTKGVNVNISGNNNINIEPREALGDGSGKNDPTNANRKGGNIALKPGDDSELWGHKRGSSKNDEVSVKVLTEVPKISDPTKTDEVAAKLQLNTGDIVLRSDDKQTDPDEMNITVNKAANTRGYLKVRAQAIDLRCEDHGGIALQPKGEDSNHFKNKIKFEHGGGDGLEFGTFNPDHTSLYTTDYRFKKDGVIKLSTRTPIARNTTSDTTDPNYDSKYKADDPTTHYYYEKAKDLNDQIIDDFYDVIDDNDPTCTWEDIVTIISELKTMKTNGQGPWEGTLL